MKPLNKAAKELKQRALSEIALRYNADGTSPRAYHNTEHTMHVVNDVGTLGRHASLTDRQILLLEVAAAFHDVVHNGDDDPTNEKKSADYALKCMKEYPLFSEADMKVVRDAIQATKCILKYPKITQSPGNDFICQLLCDADLASFGKPFDEFYKSAMCYFEELYGAGPEVSDHHDKFVQAEIVLLGNHEFWTKEAKRLFPNTGENIGLLKKI